MTTGLFRKKINLFQISVSKILLLILVILGIGVVFQTTTTSVYADLETHWSCTSPDGNVTTSNSSGCLGNAGECPIASCPSGWMTSNQYCFGCGGGGGDGDGDGTSSCTPSCPTPACGTVTGGSDGCGGTCGIRTGSSWTSGYDCVSNICVNTFFQGAVYQSRNGVYGFDYYT